jgi:hypothetical protein
VKQIAVRFEQANHSRAAAKRKAGTMRSIEFRAEEQVPRQVKQDQAGSPSRPGGATGWLLGRLFGGSRPKPRLALVERIALAPKQSLALVEAEGRRFLVATSAEGAPAFYPLDGPSRSAAPWPISARPSARTAAPAAPRVSW